VLYFTKLNNNILKMYLIYLYILLIKHILYHFLKQYIVIEYLK